MSDNNKIPDHWTKSTWDEKAKENPLFAIMTVDEFADESLESSKQKIPEAFFEKGRNIYDRLVRSQLSDEERGRSLAMFDYGCGVGRIMRAAMEDGHSASGADISQTMIDGAKDVVPKADALCVVGEDGAVDLPDESMDVAYSFAVVQHIQSLKTHQKAIAEMCRLLKPGGLLAIQVNCEDYGLKQDDGDVSYTVNYEHMSIHIDYNELKPLRVHPQNNWSGVYVGRDTLLRHLAKCGMHVVDIWNWWPKKPRSTVFIARKGEGKHCVDIRPDPVAKAGPEDFRRLLKTYGAVSVARLDSKRKLQQIESGGGEAG